MKNEIVILDLFSGIGGFSKAFEAAGFTIKKHFFSEVDRNAIANYKYNFKNAEYVGPVEFIRGASLPQVDVITFGSPCQDFSLAGKREGLNGERSSLIQEAIRLISEKKPSFFIWENVKGAFSSNNSQDFWAIIQAFANIGHYNIEWQLLNTLWILPQNRERIYLVGHLATSERGFRPIFPFTKNDRLFKLKTESIFRQSQTKYCSTIKQGFGNKADDTFIKAKKYSHHQQDRIYDPTGAMCSIPKNRTNSKVNIFSTHPRTGDPKIGGTGFLTKENEAYCLDSSNSMVIETENTGIRRLTEIECERLQGFTDNWTQFGCYLVSKKVVKYLNKNFLTPTAFGKIMHHAHTNFKTEVREIASTNRYEMLGNAVTSTLVQIIATKIKENYEWQS